MGVKIHLLLCFTCPQNQHAWWDAITEVSLWLCKARRHTPWSLGEQGNPAAQLLWRPVPLEWRWKRSIVQKVWHNCHPNWILLCLLWSSDTDACWIQSGCKKRSGQCRSNVSPQNGGVFNSEVNSWNKTSGATLVGCVNMLQCLLLYCYLHWLYQLYHSAFVTYSDFTTLFCTILRLHLGIILRLWTHPYWLCWASNCQFCCSAIGICVFVVS